MAAVGATPAAASFVAGQCVVTVRETDAYIEGCPERGDAGTVSKGEQGEISKTCTDSNSEQWAQVV